MKRARRLGQALVALAALSLGGCGGAPATADVNLLVVVWDTTRADRLSPYGHDVDLPHLEALAARGLVFDEVRSVSSLTPVSAASFMSGHLPPETGVRTLIVNAGAALRPEISPLAEWLGASGRETAAFVSAPPMGHRYGFDRGFDVFDDDVAANAEHLRREKVGNAYQRRADETTDRALDWLAAREADRPFGMLLHFFDAHDPSLVPPRDFLAERVDFPLPPNLDQQRHLVELFDGARPGRGGPRADDLRALYDAELEYMDVQLGRMLTGLEAAGELDDTLIVFLADHGESLGQHDFWTHGLMWDEQLRVPLIFAGPGVARTGREALPLSLLDLAPTLAEALALDAPDGLQGRSFASLLAAPDPRRGPRPAVAEAHHAPGDRTGRPEATFMVFAEPFKLIVTPGAAPQLFDLSADPGELTDLAAAKPSLVQALQVMLATELGPDNLGGAGIDLEALDPEARSMLEGLGYL